MYELCQQVLHDQQPPQQTHYGYSDDDAFAVGLLCGGELDVWVQRINPATRPFLAAALTDAVEGRTTAIAQIVNKPPRLLGGHLILNAEGRLSSTDLDADTSRMVTAQAQALLRAGRTADITLGGTAATCPDP